MSLLLPSDAERKAGLFLLRTMLAKERTGRLTVEDAQKYLSSPLVSKLLFSEVQRLNAELAELKNPSVC